MSVLADWLVRQPGPERCAPAPRRALAAIRRCRTPELGGQVYRCADCTQTDFAYHSCHHRACPKCGALEQKQWTEAQEGKLLEGAPYFLLTFTLPAQLREFAYQHLIVQKDPYLSSAFLKNMWDQHQSKTRDRSSQLWNVLMFRLWLQKFKV